LSDVDNLTLSMLQLYLYLLHTLEIILISFFEYSWFLYDTNHIAKISCPGFPTHYAALCICTL